MNVWSENILSFARGINARRRYILKCAGVCRIWEVPIFWCCLRIPCRIKCCDFSQFSGFTTDEVRTLCDTHNMDFDKMQAWYDGYKSDKTELYCPNSVVQAIEEQSFDSYWTKTEVYEALANYIAMNYDGLYDTVEKLLACEDIEIDTGTFQNDMVIFHCADDVLTLLVHLGYLAYRSDTKCVYIPNKEVRDEFIRSMKVTGLWKETIEAVLKSKHLLADTLAGKADAVADCIRRVHEQNSSVLNYNNEQSLRFIVLIAYYYAREQYNIIQELPAGEGFADIVLYRSRSLMQMPISLWWSN